ncbi:hypothetical protein ACFFGQ_18345, partial [Rufibacter quisquiliarum]
LYSLVYPKIQPKSKTLNSFTLYFSKLGGPNAIISGFIVAHCFSFNSLKEKWELLKARKYLVNGNLPTYKVNQYAHP